MNKAKLVDDFLRRRRKKLFRGVIPKTVKSAELRFVCVDIAGGCELSGKQCAERHVFAKRRHENGLNSTRGFDSGAAFDMRCDKVCAECCKGKARAELLDITDIDLRRRAVKRSVKARAKAGRMSATPAQLTILLQKEEFTTADIVDALQITRWSAAKWCKRHFELGDIKKVRKDGRRWVYVKSDGK